MSSGVRIEHVALWVRDLDGMRAFYVNHLGAIAGPKYHNAATGFTSYFLTFPGGGARVELMRKAGYDEAAGGTPTGYAHIALALGSREAVDDTVRWLRREKLARLESGPRTTGDGYYEAVILDPEGNRIELTA